MNKLIVDFFRNTPLYIKDNKIEESNFNLLQQTYSVDGNNYFLNCENSRVIRIDNNTYTSTFYSEMNTFREKNQITTKNNEGLDLLLKILSTKLNSDNLKFLFPDIFNEFDLSKLYKVLKRGYKKVESMPKSIATVFYYENIKKLKVIPRWNGKGTAKIIGIGEAGMKLKDEELNNIKTYLDNEIITDAEFTVKTIKEKSISLTFEAILNKEYNDQSAIELTKSTLNQVFLDKLFEENRIYYAEVIDKLLEIKAFKKISNIDINNTKEDILLEDEDLINVLNITLKTLD